MLKNKNKGITLVALVITIIILLILAGISISSLTNTGIFQRAKDAKQKSANAELEQNTKLDEYENEIDNYLPKQNSNKTVEQAKEKVLSTEKNIELVDAKENKIVVPAGFKIIGDATTVDKGIVIEDATVDKDGKPTATAGSQFVWVPVGKITNADGTKTEIKLNRYTFASDGTPTEKNEEVINTYYHYQELATSDKGNTVAKNITIFKNSVKEKGGYYIGRYEARKNETSEKLTEVNSDSVWTDITQPNAATQARNMYDEKQPFTSDLMNSYAWDTAITFIQKCTDKTNYANQTSLNESLSQTGTTNDNPCNIFDMASNVCEWTTETCRVFMDIMSGFSYGPCVVRGGGYTDSSLYPSCSRISIGSTSYSYSNVGFRPLLYVNV